MKNESKKTAPIPAVDKASEQSSINTSNNIVAEKLQKNNLQNNIDGRI